ncbi:hypothetical protein D3C80_1485750 [compost metagenome]
MLGRRVAEHLENGFFTHLSYHCLAQLAIVQVVTGNFDFYLANRVDRAVVHRFAPRLWPLVNLEHVPLRPARQAQQLRQGKVFVRSQRQPMAYAGDDLLCLVVQLQAL